MSESRVSTRANPIRQVRAPLFYASKDAAAQMWATIHNSASSQFAVPYTPDRSTIKSQGVVERTIYIDTQYRRYNAGGYAFLAKYNQDGSVKHQEVVRVLEVYSDRIVTQDDLINTYLPGDDVFPVMICLPALAGNTCTPITDRVGTITLEAREAYGATMIPPENIDYTPTVLKSHPVYPFAFNWGSEVAISVSRGGEIIASGSGDRFYTQGPSPSITQTVTSSLVGKAQSWEANGFLNHIRGMAKSFWAKGIDDMLYVQGLSGGNGSALSIRVDKSITPTDLRSLEYLWIVDSAGTLDIVKIEDRIEQPEYIDIVTESTDLIDIRDLYTALLVRLTSDEVTETYITEELSEIQLSMMELVSGYE